MIKKLFFRKSLSSVVGTFLKAKRELEELISQRECEVKSLKENMARIQAEVEDKESEKKQAERWLKELKKAFPSA